MINATTGLGALPPPPGVIPKFDAPDHDAYRDNFIICLAVCYTCTVLVCVIRAAVKTARREILPDDCELVPSSHDYMKYDKLIENCGGPYDRALYFQSGMFHLDNTCIHISLKRSNSNLVRYL